MNNALKTTGRYDEIDILKGIGIILMVWGHCGAPFHNYIYLFHMAIFFMASGFCWSDKCVTSVQSCKSFFAKRIKRLYLPYIFFNVLVDILVKIFRMNIYGESISLFSEIKIIIRTLLFDYETQLGGATWFLRTLFLISMLHFFVCFFGYRFPRIKTPLFVLVILVNVILAQFYAYRFPYFAQATCAAYIAFCLGIMEKILVMKLYYKMSCFIHFIVVIICGFGLAILTRIGRIELGAGLIVNVPFFTVSSLMGWHMILSFSIIIKKVLPYRFFIYLGKHTMSIMLFHFIAFKIVTFMYVLISNSSIDLLKDFPVLNVQVQGLWIVYFFVGLLCPLLFEVVFSKCRYCIGKKAKTICKQ